MVVLLRAKQIRQRDRVRLCPGVGTDFANEAGRRDQINIVPKVDVIIVYTEGSVRISRAGDTVGARLVVRQCSNVFNPSIGVVPYGQFVVENLMQTFAPGSNGLAGLFGQTDELALYQVETLERGLHRRLQTCPALGGTKVIGIGFVVRTKEGLVIQLLNDSSVASGVDAGHRRQQGLTGMPNHRHA